jgi:ATP-binding cassette subfamily B protein IrtB
MFSAGFLHLYALISGERIMEIRNQPEVQGTEELTEDYTIHFKEVSFSYKDEPVLQKINVEIQPRTLTAS